VSRGLADTSVFIADTAGWPLGAMGLPDELAISVMTIGELRAGLLAASDVVTRDQRLAALTQALGLDPIPIDESVVEAWALLLVILRDGDLHMPVIDSWIAATALSLGVPLVTRDDDYVEVPGLEIIRV
jgi:predicted nucleic acid-binding protein